jgi:hypothetical protein
MHLCYTRANTRSGGIFLEDPAKAVFGARRRRAQDWSAILEKRLRNVTEPGGRHGDWGIGDNFLSFDLAEYALDVDLDCSQPWSWHAGLR